MPDRIAAYVQVLELIAGLGLISEKLPWILDAIGLQVEWLQDRTHADNFLIERKVKYSEAGVFQMLKNPIFSTDAAVRQSKFSETLAAVDQTIEFVIFCKVVFMADLGRG